MKPLYFDDFHVGQELINQRGEVVQTGTTTVLLTKRKTPEGNL